MPVNRLFPFSSKIPSRKDIQESILKEAAAKYLKTCKTTLSEETIFHFYFGIKWQKEQYQVNSLGRVTQGESDWRAVALINNSYRKNLAEVIVMIEEYIQIKRLSYEKDMNEMSFNALDKIDNISQHFREGAKWFREKNDNKDFINRKEKQIGYSIEEIARILIDEENYTRNEPPLSLVRLVESYGAKIIGDLYSQTISKHEK